MSTMDDAAVRAGRPVAAVMRRTYLGRSETWIYSELKHGRRYRRIVFTTRVENLDLFPWPDVYLPASLRRFSLGWWKDRLGRRLLGREPYFERIVRRENVVVLHAHFGYDAVWALPLKRRTGLPLVTTFHGGDLYHAPTVSRFRRAYERLFERGERFIVLGERMRTALVGLGCPPEKVRIVHLSVDLKEWPYVERAPHDGPLRLLFVGRLIEVKGLRYILEALALLKRQNVPVELRVIGYVGATDVADMDYERRVRELGIEDRVVFLGFRSLDEVRAEMQRADVFLQCSVTTAEGQIEGGHPTTIVEAQASGCPVIATRHSDIPAAVLDGVTGWLVAEKRPEQLADRIAWFSAHRDALPEFGRSARRLVERQHNAADQVSRLETVYDEARREAGR